MKCCFGRAFEDKDWYELIERKPYHYNRAPPWLYTVDTRKTLENNTLSVNLVRWKGRNINPKGRKKKVWRYSSSYAVYSQSRWNTAKEAVDFAFSQFMDSSPKNNICINEAINREINRLIQRDAKTQGEIKRKDKIIQKQRQNLLKAERDELRKNYQAYKKILNNFKKLIESGAKEQEIHKFIKENKANWIFGFEYEEVEHEVSFPPSSKIHRFDLMLKRYDGFKDILELKGADIESLFTKRGKPRKILKDAIMQVINYLYACNQYGNTEIFKPGGYIVLGKKTKEPKLLRLLSYHLHGIEIKTYGDIIKKAKMTLDAIKNFKE